MLMRGLPLDIGMIHDALDIQIRCGKVRHVEIRVVIEDFNFSVSGLSCIYTNYFLRLYHHAHAKVHGVLALH
jgi:hypothetical protein